MIDHRKVLDSMTGTRLDLAKVREERGELDLDEKEVLGFRFKQGDEVTDQVTGKKGVVLDGQRIRIEVQTPRPEGG